MKRNVEIVALVKARKTAMRRIGERYRLDVSTIYTQSPNEHGVYLRTPDPKKPWVASHQPRDALTHVAQGVGFDIHPASHLGAYSGSPPSHYGTKGVRVLRGTMASSDIPREAIRS